MILNDVKNYVKSQRQVSLHEIALHFDMEAEALQGMLDFLVSKGRISQNASPACPGGCSCSMSESNDVYSWNPQLGNISITLD